MFTLYLDIFLPLFKPVNQLWTSLHDMHSQHKSFAYAYNLIISFYTLQVNVYSSNAPCLFSLNTSMLKKTLFIVYVCLWKLQHPTFISSYYTIVLKKNLINYSNVTEVQINFHCCNWIDFSKSNVLARNKLEVQCYSRVDLSEYKLKSLDKKNVHSHKCCSIVEQQIFINLTLVIKMIELPLTTFMIY